MTAEHLLSMLFGLEGFSNPLIHGIFEKFNTIVLSIGVMIFSYKSLTSTVRIAQTGNVLDGGWSFSPMLLMRTILGLALLAPMPDSGYSLIQMSGFKLAMYGSNIATQTVTYIANSFVKGESITKTAELSQGIKTSLQQKGEELAWDLMNSAICMTATHSLNRGHAINTRGDRVLGSLLIAGKNIYPDLNIIPPYLIATFSESVEYTSGLNIGINDPTYIGSGEEFSRLCGSYNVKSNVTVSELNGNLVEIDNIAKLASKKKSLILSAMFKHILPLVARIVAHRSAITEHYDPFIRELIKECGNIYVVMISNGLVNPNKIEQTSETYKIEEKIHQKGWIAMPALISDFDQTPKITLLSTATEDHIITDVPTGGAVSPTKEEEYTSGSPQQLKQVGKYLTTREARQFLHEKLLIVSRAKALDSSASSTSSTPHSDVQATTAQIVPKTILTDMHSTFSDFLGKTGIDSINEKNPIGLLAEFGTSISSIVMRDLSTSTFTMNLNGIILVILLICGAILAFYIPLMPCIIYLTVVIGWFILVAQSFIVLPLIALNVMVASNDLGNRISKDLELPVDMVIRPFLIVISFILSMFIYKISIALVNFTIEHYLAVNVIELNIIVCLITYTLLNIIIMNLCFASFFTKLINKMTAAAAMHTMLAHQFIQHYTQAPQQSVLPVATTQPKIETGQSRGIGNGKHLPTSAAQTIPQGMTSGISKKEHTNDPSGLSNHPQDRSVK